MMAGGLTDRIEIFKPITQENSFGEREVEFEKTYSTRAEIVNNRGSRYNQNNEIFFSHNKLFRVRRYVPVSDFCRIKWKTKFYRILNIEELEKSQMIEIETELINE